MKFNLDFYHENEKESKISDIENEIIENYIDKYDRDKYKEILEKDDRIEVTLALSEIRKNIYNWYPFKKNERVLEIGANLGETTEIFIDKFKEVIVLEENIIKAKAISKRYNDKNNIEVIVCNPCEIKLEKNFDYIIINDIYSTFKCKNSNEIIEKLNYLSDYIEDNGKILFTLQNKFGLANWVEEENKIKDINGTIYVELKEILEHCKLKSNRIYYPLPDFRMTNVIYTDDMFPNSENISRNLQLYKENSFINGNTTEIYKELINLKEDNFKYFANAFLVELSKEEIDREIKFISYSNLRKYKYRMITTINGNYVYKKINNPEAIEHLNKIKKNIDIMNITGIKTLDSYDEEKIISKYSKYDTLDKVIIKILQENKIDEFWNLINKYKDELKKIPIAKDDYTIFEKYGIQIEQTKKDKMTFLKNGLWDLIFQNCFYIEGEFYFYDQEWYEDNVPLEYILYRTIIYFPNIFRYISKDEIMEKLNIKEFENYFFMLDNNIQNEIRDKRIWKLYTNTKTIKDLIMSYEKSINDEKIVREDNQKKQEYINRLEQENNNLKIKNNSLEFENDELLKKIKLEKEKYIGVINSNSWKITKPFRKLRSKKRREK